MSEFQVVAHIDDLAPGEVIGVEVESIQLAIARDSDGTIHALGDVCPHQEVNLSDGEVYDSSLECWKHSSQFDLRTGMPRQLPARTPVPVFPVHVDQASGAISVLLSPINLS